jgi:hypothetical protein
VAFAPDSLEAMAKIFAVYFPPGFPLPQIISSAVGYIVVEWASNGHPSIDINITDKTANFHIYGLGNEDDLIEKDFQLNDLDSIVEFLKFLEAHIK